jgi:hypothetical protein
MAAALGVISTAAFLACDQAAMGPTGVAGIDKFRGPGPEQVRQMGVNGFTLFLGSTATQKPGLTWANGTGATPGSYTGILTRVASYGVQVVASNSTQTGTGTQTAQGVGVLVNGNFNVIPRFCASGHSQGGSGSVNATRMSAAIICTIPVEPDNRVTAQSNGRDIKGPALVLCGSADNLAPCGANNSQTNGSGLYNQATVPITQITIMGANHTGNGSPVGQGGLFAALVTAQTQAVLLNDAQARAATFGPQPGAAAGRGLQNVRSKNF